MPPAQLLTLKDRRAVVQLERKALHRFLVGYLTARRLAAHPNLRALLIAGIDVYPGPFPMLAHDLVMHLDAVLRVKLPEAAIAAGGTSARKPLANNRLARAGQPCHTP